MKHRLAGLMALCGFMTMIPVANVWLDHFGLWRLPLLGPVSSGVIWIGLAFVLRDVGQLLLGRWWSYLAIVVGVLLSWSLASPALAVASGASFACSEVLDAAIYTPLANRAFLRATLVSGWVGSLADSAVFVDLAFHSFQGWWQLGVVKALVVATVTPGAYVARRRLSSAPRRTADQVETLEAA
ncbi:MAG: VUT family protein [Acidimicrobiales bacterium]